MITKIVFGVTGAWNRFWFESNRPAQMRVFRAALGAMLFVFYCIRTLDLELFFADGGMLPVSIMQDVMPMHYRPSLLVLFPGEGALWNASQHTDHFRL